MNTLRVIWCALFLCLVLPCAAVPLQPSPFATDALNVMQQYAQTLKNGTPAEIAAWYAPDGQLLLPGTLPITGPKEVEAFLAPLVKQAKVTDVSVKIDVGQGTARFSTLMGTYTETFVVGTGKPQTVTGRFASEWQTGVFARWRISRLMMQPAPAK